MRALVCAVLGLAAIGSAQAAPKLVERYDPDLIAKIAKPMDYTVAKKTEPAHHVNPRLDFTGPRGETWSAQGDVCDGRENKVCTSIILSARLATKPGDNFDRAAYASHFNRNEAAVYMWAEGKDIRLNTYIILDGGVSQKAVEQYILAFSTVLRHTMDDLDPSLQR